MLRVLLLAVMGATGCARASVGTVMSWDQYATVEHDTPYIVKRAAGRGELLYFGARHIQEPTDPQVDQIQDLWNEFNPTVLLYEGPMHPSPTNLAKAIMRQGEGGVVRWLADRDHVPARSLDPGEAEQVHGLREAGYTSEEIVLWYCLRQVVHERRLVTGSLLDARMLEVFSFYRGVPGLDSMPRTIEDFDRRVRDRFSEVENWRDVTEGWSDPLTPHAWSNAFARSLSDLRDRHMVRTIEMALEDGARVFAIAGASHVVMQEPAF